MAFVVHKFGKTVQKLIIRIFRRGMKTVGFQESFDSCGPYKSVCTFQDGDISYIYTSADTKIGPSMKDGYNYSGESINAFFELTERFYPTMEIQQEHGVFFDIGANIGTTSLYVKKQIGKSMRVIGFECGKTNYDIFRINCILNDAEDIVAEYAGCSNVTRKARYRYVSDNPGGSHIVSNEDPNGMEDVTLTRLDDYCKSKGIHPNEINYIWIDVEGHEPEVLDGMRAILAIKKIPLFHEFSPKHYQTVGSLDMYCSVVSQYYRNFIDVNEYISGTEKQRSVSEIEAFAQEMIDSGKNQTDLFLF